MWNWLDSQNGHYGHFQGKDRILVYFLTRKLVASTLIKAEIGPEIKKGTTSVGHGWGSGETMHALEKVGDRWTERRHRKRLQRDAAHSGHSSSQADSEVWLKNKHITDTAALRPLPTRRAGF